MHNDNSTYVGMFPEIWLNRPPYVKIFRIYPLEGDVYLIPRGHILDSYITFARAHQSVCTKNKRKAHSLGTLLTWALKKR